MKQVLKIVKIGGKLIEDDRKLQLFLLDFAALEGPKILVHGGGVMATEIAAKLGFPTRMIDGRRVTDSDSLKVIVMTYAGLINKTVVAKLLALKANAIGLSGADGGSIISRKREIKTVDFGFVGDVEEINVRFISNLLGQGIIPVFSAISCTRDGELLNTNADSIAAELAKALSEEFYTELYYCFEKKGVLANAAEEASVIRRLDRNKYEELLQHKIISDGMLPKLQNCFEGLEKGVKKIFLGDAELLKKSSNGTEIVYNEA